MAAITSSIMLTSTLPSSSTTLTSSSTTLPSIAKYPSTERIAQEVLAGMRNNFRCSYDILPDLVHITNLEKSQTEQLYQKYGVQFLDYLKHRVHLESVKEGVELARSCIEWSRIADPITSALVAAAQCRIGEHGEATAYAATQCALKNVSTIIHITVVSDIEKAKLVRRGEAIDSVCEHSFLLLGVSSVEFEDTRLKRLKKKYQNHIHRILQRLGHGVVLDPILKLVCPVNEINTRGRALLAHTKETPFLSHTLMKNYAGWEVVLDDAKRILAIAQRPQIQMTTLSEMERNVRQLVMIDIVSKLKNIFPNSNVSWCMNVDREKIWMEGLREDIKPLKACLRSQGISTEANYKKIKDFDLNIPFEPKPTDPMVCFVKGDSLAHLHTLITKMFALTSPSPLTPAPISIPTSPVPTSSTSTSSISRIPVLVRVGASTLAPISIPTSPVPTSSTSTSPVSRIPVFVRTGASPQALTRTLPPILVPVRKEEEEGKREKEVILV